MPRRSEAAFTLVELMVAMALMVVVVMWLTQTFTVQHRTYTVVEQVTETQQNSTAIAALIEREIRASGFLVPENALRILRDRKPRQSIRGRRRTTGHQELTTRDTAKKRLSSCHSRPPLQVPAVYHRPISF